MASGTQGYEAAQQGIIENIIDRFRNRKKNDGDGKGGNDPAPNQPASVSVTTPTSSMLVEGTTVNQLMSGSSALATTGSSDITKYGEDAVLQAQLGEQRQTNQLLEAQNQLLLSASTSGAISKFDQQETQLEKTEDLSGTITSEKVKKPTWLGDLIKFLASNIGGVIAAIAKWGAIIAAAVGTRGLTRLLSNVFRNKNVLPNRRMIDVTPKPNLLKSSSVKPANQLMPSTSQVVDVKNLNKVKEAIPEGVGKVDDVVDIGKTTSKIDGAKDLSKIKNITPNSQILKNTLDTGLDLKSLNPLKALKNANTVVRGSGAAHAIPLLSSITGTINLMTGDYANAMLDYADSGADAAIIGGATGTAGMLAAGLSSVATVLSVGTLVGYVGEWTLSLIHI